jgi:hypothetical protein
MKIRETKHGFIFHDLLELQCTASSRDTDKKKWCAVALKCNGKVVEISCSKRQMFIKSNRQIIRIDKEAAK